MDTEIRANKSKQQGVKIVLGGFFLVFGFAFIQYYVGYLLWLLIPVLLTYKTGIEINFNDRKVRNYWGLLGSKKGKWCSLAYYDAISIKRVKKGVRRYSSGLQSADTFDTYYQIILLDQNNRSRQFLLFTGKDKVETKYLANNWSISLQLPIISYSAPKN